MIKKAIIILILFSLFFIVQGCVKLNPIDIAKANEQVNDFLEEYPNAQLAIVYLEVDKVISDPDFINHCQGVIPKTYYKILIEDASSGLSIVSWIDEENERAVCVFKKGTTTTIPTTTSTISTTSILEVSTTTTLKESTTTTAEDEESDILPEKDEAFLTYYVDEVFNNDLIFYCCIKGKVTVDDVLFVSEKIVEAREDPTDEIIKFTDDYRAFVLDADTEYSYYVYPRGPYIPNIKTFKLKSQEVVAIEIPTIEESTKAEFSYLRVYTLNCTRHTPTHCAEEAPLSNIQVELKDSNDNIIISGKSNSEGIFISKEVPEGTYSLYVKDVYWSEVEFELGMVTTPVFNYVEKHYI